MAGSYKLIKNAKVCNRYSVSLDICHFSNLETNTWKKKQILLTTTRKWQLVQKKAQLSQKDHKFFY
jgi:hypothetical protein